LASGRPLHDRIDSGWRDSPDGRVSAGSGNAERRTGQQNERGAMSVSIVLADDHPLVRGGLRGVLEAEPGFRGVGGTGGGLEAVRLTERLQPDVLVLDLMMPGLGGLDVLPIVRQRSPQSRVVVLSMFANEDFVLQALRNGAVGYVLKGCEPAHAAEAVRRASACRRYLSPGISERAFDAYQQKAEATPPDPHDLLTP